VACNAKPAKAKGISGLILVAVFTVFLGMTTQVAEGDASTDLNNALTALNLAAGSATADDTKKEAKDESKHLDFALKDLGKVPTGTAYESHRAAALQFTRSALDASKKEDPDHNLADLIHSAITEVQAAIAMASQIDTAAAATAATPPAPDHPAVTVALPADEARAVVLIKGDNAEGTGFLVKTADGPTVVTNLHVISDNPNLKITTNTGQQITVLSLKGASDRDLAMFAIKDQNYSYLPLATDIGATAQSGDEVVTPGNSEGGEVMLNTKGKLLGIGPDRIEFDNPIYHGNSGGPVIHTKSGQVLGVVTQGIKVVHEDDLDKTSFASRNSAIAGSIRYFGLRIDTVPKWEPYDLQRFQGETAFLEQFNHRSRCLDSYLNTPNDNKPESVLYLEDAQIVKANTAYVDQLNGGGDTSQKLEALREWMGDLNSLADADMDTVQQTDIFYTFDQQRAKDELAYRKALKKELDEMGNNVSRESSVPRTNN
jgi:S1-C subfamily serine protease